MLYGEKRSGVKIEVKKIRGSAADGAHTLKAKRRLTLQGSGWNGLQKYESDAVNPLFLSPGRGKLGRSGRLVRQADGIMHFCMSPTFRPTN